MATNVSKFQPGARVRRKDGALFSNGQHLATISPKRDIGTGNPFLCETKTYIAEDDLLLVSSPSEKVSDDGKDIVHRPDHYSQFPVEPIEMIMRNDFEFWRGSIIKYASRAGSKIYDGKGPVQSEITDLQKIQRFAQMRINQLNGEAKL